jgi:acyl-CoA reductase-like NAD-dependent aldehyde dehydrogenase
MPMLHLPILRHGRPYRSVDRQVVVHHRTGEPFVEISQANAGLIRRDLGRQAAARAALAARPTHQLVELSARAADAFLHATLPLDPDAGIPQSPDDYFAQLSATTGLPFVMGRRNMQKIAGVLANVEHVLAGLTRGLDLAILDRGIGAIGGRLVSFFPRTDALGVVLPSNSPGVHSLWVPSIALKTPLVLKPGGAEPWTPLRIAQAFVHAGCPPEAFGYYPTDHAGATEILRGCGRGMVFGDVASVSRWANDARIERHGPGYSKVVIGADAAGEWERHLDVIVTSIVDNGGRSCVNASSVWVTAHADAIAEALAARLAAIVPRAADDPAAAIAPFTDPQVAHRIAAMIDQGLAEPGARDVTADHRRGPRLVERGGCSYLLPTIVRAEPLHPLANREFLFPFASVVQVDEADIPDVLGPTLVVTAITSNDRLATRLLASPRVDRLNLGAIPTNQIVWDQPHEGNLFEHLYGRRSIQRTA